MSIYGHHFETDCKSEPFEMLTSLTYGNMNVYAEFDDDMFVVLSNGFSLLK